LNNRPFLIFTAKNVATPVPEFSFNIETSTVIGDFCTWTITLENGKKVAKHILRL